MAKQFKQLAQVNKDTALVVDCLNLCFRFLHKGQTEFAGTLVETIKSFAKSYHCGKIIVTADKGSSSYRKEIYPDYKGNRDYSNKTEEEQEKFLRFIEEYELALDECEHEGMVVLRYSKVEADDIAAYVTKYKDYYGINKIWLISSDRDWDLLVNEDVSRFSYVTRKETTVDNWPYDVPPEMYLTYKCLVGDTGDNIQGVQGIGPKRAISIIQEYGDINDIIDSLPLPGKQKFIQELNKSEDLLLLNVELMDLLSFCEDAIGGENLEDIRAKLSNA